MQIANPAPKKRWTAPTILDKRPGHTAPHETPLDNETTDRTGPTTLPRAA